MDDRFFLDQLDQKPNDPEILREYAQWLSANDDARGELLTAELDRRELQSRADDLRHRVFKLAADREPEWLDGVFPLLVHSPCNGTFYAAPAPDSPPFVSVGDRCAPDAVIGIVENCKVFYKVPAEWGGVVSRILVSDGQSVTYEQPLVRLKHPSR